MATPNVPDYPSPNDPGYVAPGWTTSEWWLAVIGNVVAVLSFWAPHLSAHIGTWVPAVAAAAAAVGNVAYAIARAITKRAAALAVAQTVTARTYAVTSAHQGAASGLGDVPYDTGPAVG